VPSFTLETLIHIGKPHIQLSSHDSWQSSDDSSKSRDHPQELAGAAVKASVVSAVETRVAEFQHDFH